MQQSANIGDKNARVFTTLPTLKTITISKYTVH